MPSPASPGGLWREEACAEAAFCSFSAAAIAFSSFSLSLWESERRDKKEKRASVGSGSPSSSTGLFRRPLELTEETELRLTDAVDMRCIPCDILEIMPSKRPGFFFDPTPSLMVMCP